MTKRKRHGSTTDLSTLSRKLLTATYLAGPKASLDEIRKQDKTLPRKGLQAEIRALLAADLLKSSGRNRFSLHPQAEFCKGSLVQNRRGFGFVKLEPTTVPPKITGDVFIPAREITNAIHGDTVLLLVDRGCNPQQPSGRIIGTISTDSSTISGTMILKRGRLMVQPHDPGFPFLLTLQEDELDGLEAGDSVIVEKLPTEFRPYRQYFPVTLSKVIGKVTDTRTQLEIVIHDHKLPRTFSRQALVEAESLHAPEEVTSDRDDLRNILHVTIDGDDARDFDDAIFVEKNGTHYRLFVSIADVSCYVPPGSALDREAFARGTSVYFPQKVLPMLPDHLSNDLCSLRPGRNRCAVTAILTITASGEVTNCEFKRTLIRSHYRFTYTKVEKILKDRSCSDEERPFLKMLSEAAELAEILGNARARRGSLSFEIPEPKFSISPNGEVVAISTSQRFDSHTMIEEFMLAANEAVARFLRARKTPAMYRVHERPGPETVDEFKQFLASLGLDVSGDPCSSQWFSSIIAQVKDSDLEYLVNTLLLRHLQQAQYSVNNIGHFGLATGDYLHFTSPIRRYPDLMAHRTLIKLLENTPPKAGGLPPDTKKLERQAAWLSQRERNAIKAERALADRLKVLYLLKKIGERFSCLLSGIADDKVFIDIPEICTGGAIDLDLFSDDYYIVDHDRHRLFGEISGRILRIGDRFQATLIKCDPIRGKLSFAPVLPLPSA